MQITICRLNLNNTATNFKCSKVCCSTTDIGNKNNLIAVAINSITITQCGGCRLIDNTTYIQTCNFTRILNSSSRIITIVCWTSDDSISNLLAKIILCSLLHLLKNHSRNLLRCIKFSININTR